MDIFVTDAAFDFKSKTSIIGIKNLSNGKTYQRVFKDAKNPFEAEKMGIQEIILISVQEELRNVLIYCDNKGAVVHSKREFFSNDILKSKFNFIQFVWIPREYTHIADDLSKLISDVDLQKDIIDTKADNLNIIKENKSNIYLEHHVNDLNPSMDDTSDTIRKRIFQFIALKGENKFNSKLFKGIDSLSFEEMDDLIVMDIEDIEGDIDNLDDDILKIIARSIIDLLILA